MVDFPALPPEEAIAYFKAKGFDLPKTFAWQDMWQTDHATAFTVAKSTGFNILNDLHTSLVQAMQGGQTFDQWKRNIIPTLQAQGWWGRQKMVDPANPDDGPQDVQLGSVRRLRTIFDVNTRMAYAAGRWNQIERTAKTAPWLRYAAILDSKTRPLHAEWHGTVLSFDHPWWDTHFPPNGWYCRCTTQQMSDRDLTRYGFKPSLGPKDDGPPKTYTNPRTGEVSQVPNGIDPGFAYNPGKVAFEAHAARVASTKWIDAPPGLTAAAQAESVRYMLPAMIQDFGTWVTDNNALLNAAQAAKSAGVPSVMPLTGETRVVGAFSQTVLDFLAQQQITPDSGAITIDDKTVIHFLRDAKAKRGASIPVEDLQRLPEILAQPKDILWDTVNPALLYVFDTTGVGALGKVVVRVDFPTSIKREKVITNAVRTGGLVQPKNLEEPLPNGQPRYLRIPP